MEDDDEDTAITETELVTSSIRTLLFYFMWKVQALSTALNEGKAAFTTAYFEALTKSRETFADTLVNIMNSRAGLDNLRVIATTTYLDLQTLFSTLRNLGTGSTNDEDTLFQIQSLIHEIGPETQALLSKIHNSAERTWAKKSGLDHDPADDDEPASEDEPEDEDEASDEEDEAVLNERLRSSIFAEQRLCEITGKLVLAIIARVIDASGAKRGALKKRLLRNKTVLGQNYREVLSYLEERKPRAAASRSKGKQAAKSAAKSASAAPPTPAKESKSAEHVNDEEEEHPETVEEDEDEDLRARGLVEEDIDREGGDGDEDEGLNSAPEDEDEVMGD
jgi:cohesin complex subunit SA-1/2